MRRIRDRDALDQIQGYKAEAREIRRREKAALSELAELGNALRPADEYEPWRVNTLHKALVDAAEINYEDNSENDDSPAPPLSERARLMLP